MILNCPAVSVDSVSKIKPDTVRKPYFTGSNNLCEDEFIAQIYINSYISPSVNEDECREIIEKIKSKPASDKGVNAEFFNLNNIGVKKQNDSMALGKEASALKYLNSLGVTNIPKTKILFMYKYDNYLVTDVLKGQNPAIEKGVKLTQKNISSFFNTFFQMDKALFLHYDLHKGNILIDKDKANIVDFGNYNYVGNYGSLITSDNYSGSTPDSIEKVLMKDL